jgi:hypothetical protein
MGKPTGRPGRNTKLILPIGNKKVNTPQLNPKGFLLEIDACFALIEGLNLIVTNIRRAFEATLHPLFRSPLVPGSAIHPLFLDF